MTSSTSSQQRLQLLQNIHTTRLRSSSGVYLDSSKTNTPPPPSTPTAPPQAPPSTSTAPSPTPPQPTTSTIPQHTPAQTPPQPAASPQPAAPTSTPPQPPPATPTPPPEPDPQPHDYTRAPEHIALTDESLQNIQRAPDGTRFYCVTSTHGTTHCAASNNLGNLDPSQHSTISGQAVDPIAPDWQHGTGHQQVARLSGLDFDETTARRGYVDGEGYGLSIEKVDDCNRNYTFKSAFNLKTNTNWDRSMPSDMASSFEEHLESAFPPCPCTEDKDFEDDTSST